MGRSRYAKVDVVIHTGIPLFDRIIYAFFKIATIAAIRIALQNAYNIANRGSISTKIIEESLKKMCKEGAYWGAIAGVYAGMEFGVKKIRGSSDWKNAMIGGALTGALVAWMTNGYKDKIVMDAITGGAVATAAKFISYLT